MKSMESAHILVIDDEPGMCHILRRLLERENYTVTTVTFGPEGLAVQQEQPFDLALVDLRMPEMDGLEVLTRLKAHDPDIEVIVMTAFATVETAVEAMSRGARSYIRKPFNNDEVLLSIRNALEHRRLIDRNRYLTMEIERRYGLAGLIGSSEVMQSLYKLIERVAPTDSTVLLLGESGTGKELVARALHLTSPRREAKFVPVNCGALPRELIESELFGHEKGSFSGAHNRKIGLFEAADGGTLFLDEIGDLPLELQVKVLRVLEQREVRRVGATQARPVDVRIVAATNSDLERRVQSGAFREDLYYRLSIVPIHLPPLRERKDDIPELVQHFIAEGNQRLNRMIDSVSPEALRVLTEYDWPGNVRELLNTIERCMVMCEQSQITLQDLPASLVQAMKHNVNGFHGVNYSSKNSRQTFTPDLGLTFLEARDCFERTYLQALLQANEGNVTKSAVQAGLSRRYLQELMKKHDLRDS